MGKSKGGIIVYIADIVISIGAICGLIIMIIEVLNGIFRALDMSINTYLDDREKVLQGLNNNEVRIFLNGMSSYVTIKENNGTISLHEISDEMDKRFKNNIKSIAIFLSEKGYMKQNEFNNAEYTMSNKDEIVSIIKIWMRPLRYVAKKRFLKLFGIN